MTMHLNCKTRATETDKKIPPPLKSLRAMYKDLRTTYAFYGTLLGTSLSFLVLFVDDIVEGRHFQLSLGAGLIAGIYGYSAGRNAFKRKLAEQVNHCHNELSKIIEIKDITFDAILHQASDILSTGWPYPATAHARIIFQNKEYSSAHFMTTPWEQSAPIIINDEQVGILDVYSSTKKTQLVLRDLIGNFAERLGRVAERIFAEETVRQLLAEKETLLKEVDHRIKNNLSVIGGLLSLQASMIKEPAAIAILQDARGRIEVMLELYTQLYQSTGHNALNMPDFLSPAVENIIRVLNVPKNLHLEQHIDAILLNVKQIVPLAIIVYELLTNISKHAFAEQAPAPEIILSLREKPAGYIELTVADNGSGLPIDFDIDTSPGYGSLLIRSLTQQLGGGLAVQTSQGKGTSFVISFKKI